MSGDGSDADRPARGVLSRDQWRRISSLLDALLDAPAEQRGDLLAELSGGDDARRSELERLVAECEREDRLLDRPAVERFAALTDDAAL